MGGPTRETFNRASWVLDRGPHLGRRLGAMLFASLLGMPHSTRRIAARIRAR